MDRLLMNKFKLVEIDEKSCNEVLKLTGAYDTSIYSNFNLEDVNKTISKLNSSDFTGVTEGIVKIVEFQSERIFAVYIEDKDITETMGDLKTLIESNNVIYIMYS